MLPLITIRSNLLTENDAINLASSTRSISQEIQADLSEFARMYYERQYERISKLEDQRLAVTNVVITLSVVALTFGSSSPKNTRIIDIILPVTILLINIFAILYIIRSLEYIEIHRERAKSVLKLYAEEIYQIDRTIPWSSKLKLGLTRIQVLIHLLIGITTAISFY